MLLGSRWNSCELDDVKACHILRPKAPWISLNTVFVSHAHSQTQSPAKQAQAPGCERWSCLLEPQSWRTVLSES